MNNLLHSNFNLFVKKNINLIAKNLEFKKKSLSWSILASKLKYHYNFKWMGLPIIKFPNDIVVMQELIWKVKPDLIIETGVAHGGSLIFLASVMKCYNNKGIVLGVDIKIKKKNKKAIKKHVLSRKIKLIEGSSISENVIKKISKIQKKFKRVLVILDSMHTHSHVLKELEIYSNFVKKKSYIIVQDSFIELFPKNHFQDRQWNKGDNPFTAIKDFLKKNKNFKIDKNIERKIGITENPFGYIQKIK
jgi:cephalosporin hydroxylase